MALPIIWFTPMDKPKSMGILNLLTVHILQPSRLIQLVLVDLGPNNQFDWRGIHITDFGIKYLSRVPLPAAQPGCLPITGSVPGTYSYWPPEIQIMAQSHATTQSDMWALGCIGYEMCMGQKLSQYNNRLAIDNYSRGGYLDMSVVDPVRFTPEIKTIIQQCLHRNPMQRCTAIQLREYIQQLLQPAAVGPNYG
jgi:serine/threonine protein kinase